MPLGRQHVLSPTSNFHLRDLRDNAQHLCIVRFTVVRRQGVVIVLCCQGGAVVLFFVVVVVVVVVGPFWVVVIVAVVFFLLLSLVVSPGNRWYCFCFDCVPRRCCVLAGVLSPMHSFLRCLEYSLPRCFFCITLSSHI